jgi:hypothetical protein
VRSGLSVSSGNGGRSSATLTMPWMTIVIVASYRRTSSQNVFVLNPPGYATEPPASNMEYVMPVPAV